MHRIQVIDSHTGGEPTRLVVAGFPDPGPGDMACKLAFVKAQHDRWRCAAVLEPRGSDAMVAALLCEPLSPDAAAGVIFFNNRGYLGMCGHGTIGLVATLAHMGRIGMGDHRIETPVGDVTATLHANGDVSVRNVPSYRHLRNVRATIPGVGDVVGDVAWGGNWFFLTSAHGQRIASDNLAVLTDYASRLRRALAVAGVTGKDGAEIDHIELFGDDDRGADSRSFVLCPGDAYDRSPCGTGTSAKLACLAADGKLAEGDIWRQASVIGSRFEASYERQGELLIPTLRGRAHICAEATLLIDEADPFAWGIVT